MIAFPKSDTPEPDRSGSLQSLDGHDDTNNVEDQIQGFIVSIRSMSHNPQIASNLKTALSEARGDPSVLSGILSSAQATHAQVIQDLE